MRKIATLLIVLFLIIPNAVLAEEYFSVNLSAGSKKKVEVQKLQEFLTDESYYKGPISGYYFSLTQKAVLNFKKKNKIKPYNNIWDKKARTAANKILMEKYPTEEEGLVEIPKIIKPPQELAPPQSSNPSEPVKPLTSDELKEQLQKQAKANGDFVFEQASKVFTDQSNLNQVQVLKPEIVKFEANKNFASLGDSITISWEAKNAIKCAIVENQNIQIPFAGRLPSGSMTFVLEETNNLKLPKFTYYAICADKVWNTTVKQLSIITDRRSQIFPWFDTNDSWSYGNGNDRCDLSSPWNMSPNGAIFDYSSTQKLWPTKTVFSTLQLNVGNNPKLDGISLKSLTLKKIGTAKLADINLSAEYESGGAKSMIVEQLDAETIKFTAKNDAVINWPFALNIMLDPNGMSVGETFGLVIQEIRLLIASDTEQVVYPTGQSAKSLSPDMVIRCGWKK